MKSWLMIGALLTLPWTIADAAESMGTEPNLRLGAEVYNYRCVLCHGKHGLGDGVMALSIGDYPHTNLQDIRHGKDAESLRRAVIYGGTRGQLDIEMPPWGDELTFVEIESVVLFTRLLINDPERAYALIDEVPSARESSYRLGRTLFRNYCALCHGKNGEGDGKMAKIITNPPPFNLTQSRSPDSYLKQIINKGGEAMGRSPRMPPWTDELSEAELESIVLYIKSLRE